MQRYIEVPDMRGCSAPLLLNIGDVLLLHASGVRIVSGDNVVELFGPLMEAAIGDDCSIFTPMGAPNTILVRVQQTGRAVLDVMIGSPWDKPESIKLELTAR